ncbi:hypothetical protein TNCV_4936471 [Trichonephila clavipes]|nr:hypothetical protein TNCV_4936471 [Trichonephila clavipes]
MSSAECMGGRRAAIPQICNVVCSVYRQYLQPALKCNKFLPPANHNAGCRTSMAIHNATIHPSITKLSLSPNSNTTIMMLQAVEEFFSKHNVVPFRWPCLPFISPLATQIRVIFCQE